MDKISRYLAIACGWLLIGLSILIAVDVIGRKLFAFSIQGSDEIGGYVMAFISTVGFSYALAEKGHIRLNLLLPHLPDFIQAVLHFTAYLILALFAYLMLWRGAEMLFITFKLKAFAPSPLRTPLVIPQFLWVLALLWFAIHISVYIFKIIVFMLKGKIKELNQRFGEK